MNKKTILRVIALSISILSPLSASHNVSRYFPFLEKPEEVLTKGCSYVSPTFFITSAATAFKHDGGNTGIPELWGNYDLKDVIASVAAVNGATYNPFNTEPGYTDWNKKSVKFFIDGKVKSRGLMLNIEQNIFNTAFAVGVTLPVMHVNTSNHFAFNAVDSHSTVANATEQEVEMLDRVRRKVHTDLGLYGGDWAKTGIGDLDVHARWRISWDHVFKMRAIECVLQAGALIPIGTKGDKDYPSSVPFMGNGHWGVYGDALVELELKQNWKLGLLVGVIHQMSNTNKRRISYYNEPVQFSMLRGDVEIDPGMTWKVSPYFILENLTDGLHFQLRYTYIQHREDLWSDKRSDKTVKSYLENAADDSSTRCNLVAIRASKNDLTEWEQQYLTGQLCYNSKDAMKKWIFEPNFYLAYDYPFSGKKICKTHQVSIGAHLHF